MLGAESFLRSSALQTTLAIKQTTFRQVTYLCIDLVYLCVCCSFPGFEHVACHMAPTGLFLCAPDECLFCPHCLHTDFEQTVHEWHSQRNRARGVQPCPSTPNYTFDNALGEREGRIPIEAPPETYF